MEKQIQMVKEFHLAFNCPVSEEPVNIDSRQADLRAKLLLEETAELEDAMKTGDLVAAADAITDCLYVLFGTAHELGIADKLVDCFSEVHRSNMTKLDENGQPIFREDGKIMKSSRYEKPNLFKIVLPEEYIDYQIRGYLVDKGYLMPQTDEEIGRAMEESKNTAVPAHLDDPAMYCRGKGIDIVVK